MTKTTILTFFDSLRLFIVFTLRRPALIPQLAQPILKILGPYLQRAPQFVLNASGRVTAFLTGAVGPAARTFTTLSFLNHPMMEQGPNQTQNLSTAAQKGLIPSRNFENPQLKSTFTLYGKFGFNFSTSFSYTRFPCQFFLPLTPEFFQPITS